MRDKDGNIDWKVIMIVMAVGYFLLNDTASNLVLGSQLKDNNIGLGTIDHKFDGVAGVLGDILAGIDGITGALGPIQDAIAGLAANDAVFTTRLDSVDSRLGRLETQNASILSFLQNLAAGTRQQAPAVQAIQASPAIQTTTISCDPGQGRPCPKVP